MVAMVKESGVPIICCGEPMKEMIPGTSDGAVEKHVPVIAVDGNTVTVTVGEVDHTMVEEHYIEWVSLQTKQGNQRKALQPGHKPISVFEITDADEVVKAYAYCNLHGLWVSEK